jgi:hypothetical protein
MVAAEVARDGTSSYHQARSRRAGPLSWAFGVLHSTNVDSTSIGIAGEFYVLAQLAQRGLVASFTLANTKAIDILVFDESLDKLFKLEVKTTNLPPKRVALFSDEPVYSWPMSAKHERIAGPRLFFCFVVLQGPCTLPLFFIVPSSYVAEYVREQHQYWLRTRTRAVNPTGMRQFRIRTSDPFGFKDNWSILSGQSPPEHQIKLSEPWFSHDH